MLLLENGHEIDASIDWSEMNRRAGPAFIDHTAEIAEFVFRPGADLLPIKGEAGIDTFT